MNADGVSLTRGATAVAEWADAGAIGALAGARAPGAAGAPPARAPEGPAEQQLQLVSEDVRRRTRRMRWMMWTVSALVALAVFGAVAFHVFLAQTQVRLDRLSRSISQAQREYELARLDVAQSSSPATIIDHAHRLGMIDPDHVTYVNAPSPAADDAGPARTWVAVKPYLAPQP